MRTKKPIEKTYELKYTGWLSDGKSPIYLHYGTENWAEISECKMRKLKSCYKTEITIPAEATSVSFCFRDSNGNWDNNYGNDYWYTPSIGETYSCVEVCPSAEEAKAIATHKKVVAKSAAAKKTAQK